MRKTVNNTLKRILSYTTKYWHQLAISMVSTVMFGICSATPSYLIKHAIDSVIGARAMHLLLPFVTTFIALYVIKGFFMYFSGYYMEWVGNRVVGDIRTDLFSKIVNFPLAFFKRKTTGELMAHFLSDIELVQYAASRSMRNGVRSVFEASALLIVAFMQNPSLTLLMFLVGPLIGIGVTVMGKKMRKTIKSTQAHMGQLSSTLQETIVGIREIKASSNEGTETARFGESINTYFKSLMKNVQAVSITPALTEIIAMTGVGCVFYLAVRQVIAGTITPGALGSFFAALILAYQPMKRIINAYAEVQAGIAAADRVFAVMDEQYSPATVAGTRVLSQVNRGINLQNVSFAYDQPSPRLRRAGAENVLSNLTLSIAKGERVGIVGPSGCGKSTLCDLLMGFITPTSGSITIDGMELKTITPGSLRSQIGYVSQRPFLFNDTIAANVAYAKQDATQAEIEAACKTAQAHEFIQKLPAGYNTIVGEDGGLLSGGQKQRLTIARALLKDPAILLFDEATSALDSTSEKLVADAIRNIQNITVIVITHRPQLLHAVDRVLTLEGGRLVVAQKQPVSEISKTL